MDALRRAENSTTDADAGEDSNPPAQEMAAPTENAAPDLSLEPLGSAASQAGIAEESQPETRTSAEAANDPPPVEEPPTEPEALSHGRTRPALPTTRTKNMLMFGSGFILILTAVGGYYAWKISQFPVPGHFQSATLIREPVPVNTAPAPIKPAIADKTGTLPVKIVTASSPVTTPALAPQIPAVMPAQKARPDRTLHRTATPIRISKKRKTSTVNAQLHEAWRDYQQHDYLRAERQYKQVLHRYPDNRDAMLGLAAIALYRNHASVARQYYQRVLKTNPGDKLARVALQSLAGTGDVLKDSSQLKFWLQSDPNNPQLLFALGNHLATLGNWKGAQHAYFEAFRLAPTRADYAFNLAVALDQLSLDTQALNYYRKARELAGPATLFSIKQLERRITRLEHNGAPGS